MCLECRPDVIAGCNKKLHMMSNHKDTMSFEAIIICIAGVAGLCGVVLVYTGNEKGGAPREVMNYRAQSGKEAT